MLCYTLNPHLIIVKQLPANRQRSRCKRNQTAHTGSQATQAICCGCCYSAWDAAMLWHLGRMRCCCNRLEQELIICCPRHRLTGCCLQHLLLMLEEGVVLMLLLLQQLLGLPPGLPPEWPGCLPAAAKPRGCLRAPARGPPQPVRSRRCWCG